MHNLNGVVLASDPINPLFHGIPCVTMAIPLDGFGNPVARIFPFDNDTLVVPAHRIWIFTNAIPALTSTFEFDIFSSGIGDTVIISFSVSL